MDYFVFLNRLIDEGIGNANASYIPTDPRGEGWITGFSICRDKAPYELNELCDEVNEYFDKFLEDKEGSELGDGLINYWWFRYYKYGVEFVMDVVSAILVNEGKKPLKPFYPTPMAQMRATTILNSCY